MLGVDVGGVIVDRIRADGSDTSFFSDRFLETPAVAGAFDTLARLGRERFGQRIRVEVRSSDGEKNSPLA
jgi:hypothetical protein